MKPRSFSRVSDMLRTPLVVEVEYADGMWIYHSDETNLWGYGECREDALRDLHANFSYLWREFAEEQDEVLDDKARSVKHALLRLTQAEPAGV